jgi:hypothetical protein
MTQICHTPDSGLFCSRTRWLSIKFTILRKSRKSSSEESLVWRVGSADCRHSVYRRPSRAWWIGKLAI